MALPPSSEQYNAIVHDFDTRIEHLMQRRHPLWRVALASIWDFFQLLRDAWVSLAGFALVTAVTVLYLLYSYPSHAREPIEPFTVDTALLETMRLMALESNLSLPVNDLFGEILFFVIPLLGLALVFQSVLNFGRLLLDKSGRIESWQISLARTFRQHIIVCGLGSVSYRVIIQLLESGYDVVVIERDWNSEFVHSILALRVPVILGDARQAVILRQAGINRAHGLIAGTHDDLANIEIALAARRWQPEMTVVLRIFNDELDTNLENRFGRNSAFSSSALAAPTLATAAIGRSIAHVLPLPEGFAVGTGQARFLGMLQLRVHAGSPLCGPQHAIEEQFDIRLLRHLNAQGQSKYRNRKRRVPVTPLIEPDDLVVLLGPLPVLEQVRARNESFSPAHDPEAHVRVFSREPLPGQDRAYDTVIVCGLGKVGYRVVRALTQFEPAPRVVVVCLQQDTPEPFIETVRGLGAEVLFGDARLESVLLQAGTDTACSVVAVTSDDLVNLQIGLLARKLTKDIDLVLRVFSDLLAERLTVLFGVHTAFSISALAAPTMAAAGVVRGIDYAIEIGERIISAATISVQPADLFEGQTVAQIRQRHNVLVLAVRRDGQPILPLQLDTRLQTGDELVVLADVAQLSRRAKRLAAAA